MKSLNDEIKKKLAERFGLLDTEFVFLAGGREDSDGIVFIKEEWLDNKLTYAPVAFEKVKVE